MGKSLQRTLDHGPVARLSADDCLFRWRQFAFVPRCIALCIHLGESQKVIRKWGRQKPVRMRCISLPCILVRLFRIRARQQFSSLSRDTHCNAGQSWLCEGCRMDCVVLPFEILIRRNTLPKVRPTDVPINRADLLFAVSE